MLDGTNELIGLEVYNPEGLFIGIIDEIIVDVSEMRISALFIKEVSPRFATENVSITIPYEWVSLVGDIVMLDRFPKKRLTGV